MGIDPVRMYLQSFSLPDTPENRRDAWEIVGRVAQRILDREEEEARARQSTYDEDDTDYAEFLAFKEYKRQKDRSHRLESLGIDHTLANITPARIQELRFLKLDIAHHHPLSNLCSSALVQFLDTALPLLLLERIIIPLRDMAHLHWVLTQKHL
ncbi:hypothetical protein FRC05_001392 [Tulasnella sp. 425]|nr:hypothetical protein FRC05_001392 [Tulasnella sp. 425]